MKIKMSIAIIVALVAISANAEVYKCNKGGKTVYQSKPCDLSAPDSNKLSVKVQSPEEEAAAKAKLQAIEASNAERKGIDEQAAKKAFENSAMPSATNAVRRVVGAERP